MDIEKMFTRFATSKRALGATAATIRWYDAHVRAFAEWHAQQDDQALTLELMEAYMVHLRTRHETPGPDGVKPPPLADASIGSAYRALKIFFKWCQEKGLIEVSPLAGLKPAKPKPVEPRRATRYEVDTLLQSIEPHGWMNLRDYLIVHVLFFCGLRVGELVRLEEHHFDLEQRVLHLPGGKTGAGVVPLIRDVMEAFLAYQMHRPRGVTDRLFVSSNGMGGPRGAIGEDGVRQMIERRCAEAGIRRLTPHAFRHGIAMYLLNDKRVDATLVQRLLRHMNLRTTTTFYAQWTLAAMADEYRSVMEGD